MFFAIAFLLLWGGEVLAQDLTVDGVVSDVSGEVFPGVSVFVKGTYRGVETDFDGKYTIKVNKGEVLSFSFIGMITVEKTIEKQGTINITMKEDLNILDEVVVTGITTTDRRLFTGVSDKLKATDVKLAGLTDVSRTLEGRSAGVTVQNVSGTFGAAPKIRVRGATSIYGSSKPLWVVDGVILEDIVELSADALSSGDVNTLISSSVAGLNPDDIESFEVLKDGSATSIYGARAMAGVIVITTKKGKTGVSRFNYTGESTYRFIPSYDNFNIMNSQEQLSVNMEMLNGGWLNEEKVMTASESGEFGRMYGYFRELNQNGFVVENSPRGKARFLRQSEYRNTDWFQNLFNVNMMQSHSVSMSSGTDKSSYYASLSALIDPGWTKSSNVNRYTANLNTKFKLTDKLSLMALSNASFRKQKAPGTLSREVNVVSGKVKREFDINPYSFALNVSRALSPEAIYIRNYAPFNILKELEHNYIDLNVADLRFQTELKYKFTPKIDASVLGAIKYQTSSQEHNATEFSNQANAYRAGDIIRENTIIRDNNPFLYRNPDNPAANPVSVLQEGGIYRETNHSMFGYDFRTTLSYKDIFEGEHILNFYLGSEVNVADRLYSNFTGWGTQYSIGNTPFYDYRIFKKGIEENSLYYGKGKSKYRNLAFFSNATYSYKRRYTLNGTLRYEGSNKLGKSMSSRWLPTWNISGAWSVHEEDFFEKLMPTLSRLTLKASYSLTADRGPSTVSNSLIDIRSYNPWRPNSDTKEPALYTRALENSELTYEKKNELNIGAEIGLLDNRINATFDWYKRNNYDLIGAIDTQGMGGTIRKFGNVASMQTNGIELSLTSTNIKTDNFSWVTSFVYSKMNNKITNLMNNSRVIDLVKGSGFAKEGYPVRSLFSIPFKGLNEEGLPTFINQKGETTVKDVYFQERENVDFLEYSGSLDPTDVGSFGNTFTFKGLKLSVFATYSFGNVVRLYPYFSDSYSDMTALPKEFKDRWVTPGDESTTNIPVIATTRDIKNHDNQLNRAYNAYNYSDVRVAKGDFVRLKEISLGYNFPKEVTESLRVANFSVKLQAMNMFLLYSDKKLKGQDPEFFNSGGVAAPVPKQLTFTLKFGL